MALLQNLRKHGAIVLEPRHLFGRAASADTALGAPAVSGEHAVFQWNGSAWELRDLGSRNGTWVGDRRLGPGDRTLVAAGEDIAFGDPDERWTLVSDSAPSAVAWSDGAVVEGEGRFLALPDGDDPSLLIELDPSRGWIAVGDGARRVVEDGERVDVGGREYRLGLPRGLEHDVSQTAVLKGVSLDRRLETMGLDFAVSADEEYIEVTVRFDGHQQAIKPRAHLELLLVLARRRLEDSKEGVPASEAGWVYTSELRSMLRISANRYYVMAHRCRKDLEDLGIADASRILGKRTTSRQVRLGVGDITVRPI